MQDTYVLRLEFVASSWHPSQFFPDASPLFVIPKKDNICWLTSVSYQPQIIFTPVFECEIVTVVIISASNTYYQGCCYPDKTAFPAAVIATRQSQHSRVQLYIFRQRLERHIKPKADCALSYNKSPSSIFWSGTCGELSILLANASRMLRNLSEPYLEFRIRPKKRKPYKAPESQGWEW